MGGTVRIAGPWLLCGLGALCWASWSCAQEEDPDYVVRMDGQIVPLQITRDDFVCVEGRTKGGTRRIPAPEVREVRRAQAGTLYREALEALASGRPLRATRRFAAAWQTLQDLPWAAEYVQFGLAEAQFAAECFEGLEDPDGTRYPKPSTCYAAVLKANPQSRFLLDAAVKRALCLAEEGRLAEAEGAMEWAKTAIARYREQTRGLDERPAYARLSDRAEAHLKPVRARCLELKALAVKNAGKTLDLEAALAAYRGAARATERFPDLLVLAVEGELRVLEAAGRWEETVASADTWIEKCSANERPELEPVLPVAWFLKGQAHFASARALEEQGQLVQQRRELGHARWAFLQLRARYFDAGRNQAAARYVLGLCYEKLAGMEADALRHALAQWASVEQDYPRSSFARLARERLNEHLPRAKP